MSHTNMILGDNWRGEWPERIEVGHEGEFDSRAYVPKRTCRNTYEGREFRCSLCGGTYHVVRRIDGTDWELSGFSHCPGCGAEVEA